MSGSFFLCWKKYLLLATPVNVSPTTARQATSVAQNDGGVRLVSLCTIQKSHIVTRKVGLPFWAYCAILVHYGLKLGRSSRKRDLPPWIWKPLTNSLIFWKRASRRNFWARFWHLRRKTHWVASHGMATVWRHKKATVRRAHCTRCHILLLKHIIRGLWCVSGGPSPRQYCTWFGLAKANAGGGDEIYNFK